MKKISMRYLTLGNIFGYFAKSLAIMFMVALIGCTSSSTDDSDDNTPPQEQPSNPDDGDDNSGGGSGSSDNNEQISMEELVANVESAQEVIDPLFEQCETIDDLAKHLDEIKAMECVSEVEIEEETLFIILKGGLRIGWSYHEFPLDSAEDDENGEEYSSYTPATSATSSQIDVVIRAEQRDEHTYLKDTKNVGIINLIYGENYESHYINEWFLESAVEDANFKTNNNISSIEKTINTINTSDVIWFVTHGMRFNQQHWFQMDTIEIITDDIKNNLGYYLNENEEYYFSKHFCYIKYKWLPLFTTTWVSESYLKNRISLKNNAIVFCSACSTLQYNKNIANIFTNKGACAYLGYNNSTAKGDKIGRSFIEELLKGKTIQQAYESVPHSDGYATLELHTKSDGVKNYCIVHPKVKTIEKPEVEGTSATLEGVVEEWNGNKLLEGEVGFCWSKDNSQPTIKDKHIKVLDVSHSAKNEIEFSKTITDLEIATEYFYRAYLYINNEYQYGEVKSFVTDNDPDAYMRAYLIKLYNDTNGDNWDKNTNWCSGKPLDDWYGVHIDTEDGKRIYSIILDDNNLQGTLDLSGCTSLWVLECEENQLTSIDVSGCTVLHRLYCYDNKLLTYINAAECTALKTINFHCIDNQPIKLDISGCSALTSLALQYRSKAELASIDASRCTSLRTLVCYDNQLTSLDVSGCTALVKLECYKNQLTNLNVSGCTALVDLYCENNQLTSLDVSGCTLLCKLDCSNNQLTSLDVSGCTALKYLYCDNNQLTSLDVSDCSSLWSLSCRDNKIIAQITKQLYDILFTCDWLYNYYLWYDNEGFEHHEWTKNDYGWYYPGEPLIYAHYPPESWYK